MEKEEEIANPVDPQFRSPSRGEYVEIYSGDGDSDDWREAVVMKTDNYNVNTRTMVKKVVQNWIRILCGGLPILRIRNSFGGDGVICTR